MEERQCNLPRYKKEATAKTGWVGNEWWVLDREAGLPYLIATVCWERLIRGVIGDKTVTYKEPIHG